MNATSAEEARIANIAELSQSILKPVFLLFPNYLKIKECENYSLLVII
jgi:hypothetical protein